MKATKKNEPATRTCIGCRGEAERAELERFVLVEGEGLLHDLRKRAPGRGVWVHARRSCVEAAREGGFSRSLKQKVEVPPASDLVANLAGGIAQRRRDRLGDAMRGNALVAGQALVQETAKAGDVHLLILASDAGASTEKKFRTNADRKGLPVISPWSGEELGALTGREYVSVLAVTSATFAEALLEEERRWRDLQPADG